MYDHHFDKLAELIANKLHNKPAEGVIREVIKDYFEDKIAPVWQIDDVIDAAEGRGMTITAEDAIEILQDVFSNHDPEYGITWMSIECSLDDFQQKAQTDKEKEKR